MSGLWTKIDLSATPINGVDVSTRDETSQTSSGNWEVDRLSNFEMMKFDDHVSDNTLRIKNVYLEMARLSVDAYQDDAAKHSGWRPVHANELGLGLQSDPGEKKPWTMANGVFKSVGAGSVPGVSAAHVYSGDWNGESVIALSFRGTNDANDLVGWFPAGMQEYYKSFSPLLNQLKLYVRKYDIDQVLVTGHSLGGAMAQMFMDDVVGDQYFAATFGSPGAPTTTPDPRMVHFEHSQDPAPAVGRLFYGTSGERVLIPINDLNSTLDDGGTFKDASSEHDMSLYLESLFNFSLMEPGLPDFMKPVSHGPGGETRIYAGNNNSNAFGGDDDILPRSEYLYGLGGNDTINGFMGNDKIYGGAAADKLTGGPASGFGGLGRLDQDLLEGGAGNDTLNGGIGRDRLKGGDGKDVLNGGADNDILFGGANADRFVIQPGTGTDWIMDFQDDVDTIDLGGFKFASLKGAKSFASDLNGNVVFDFAGGEMLMVVDITMAQLAGVDILI